MKVEGVSMTSEGVIVPISACPSGATFFIPIYTSGTELCIKVHNESKFLMLSGGQLSNEVPPSAQVILVPTKVVPL